MRSLLSTLLLFFLLFSCIEKEEVFSGEMERIYIENLRETINVSDFATSIDYVKLSNEIMLRDIDKMHVDSCGNFYIMDSRGDGVYKFYSNGDYCKQISQQGQGPGEYIEIQDFDIENNKLIILDEDKAMYFDLDGNYLNQEKIECWNDICVQEDTLFVSCGPQSLYSINNKKTIKLATSLYPKDMLLYTHNSHLTKNGNTTYYEDAFNDTIYRATRNSYFPAFYIDFHDKKLPANIARDHNILSNPNLKKYFRDVSNFKISDAYITFRFIGGERFLYFCVYNRMSKELSVLRSLENDINGVSVTPLFMHISDKKLYSFVDSDIMYAQYIRLNSSKKEEDKVLAKRILEISGGEISEMDNAYITIITGK